MIERLDPISLTAPECRDMVRKQVRERVEGVAGRAYEIDCMRKDGSRFCAQVWGIRIEIDGGVADLVTMHDVSDIKQASRVAQQRAQLLKNAEELARIGCAEIELATGTMSLSEGMFNIFGAAPEEATVTRDWFLSRVPESERLFVQAISEGVTPGEMSEFQHRIVHADGSLRTVLHRGLAEADADGTVVRAVMILQDITMQRTFGHSRHPSFPASPRLDSTEHVAGRVPASLLLLLLIPGFLHAQAPGAPAKFIRRVP